MKNIINSIIHPTTRRTSKRLPMPENVRKGFRRYSCAVLTGAMILGLAMPAYAAGDPLTVVNNLSTFIFGLIRAVGLILLGWGIVQVGLSLQSHDPSQRSNGFLEGGLDFVQRLHDILLDLLGGSAGVLLQLTQHLAQLLCVDGQLVGADEDERDDHDDHEFQKTNFHIF